MRTITLNGYIDEGVWYGDEITPGALHDELYGVNNMNADDVRIVLNSYGGNCNAATRMFDDVRAYPGKVHLIERIDSRKGMHTLEWAERLGMGSQSYELIEL